MPQLIGIIIALVVGWFVVSWIWSMIMTFFTWIWSIVVVVGGWLWIALQYALMGGAGILAIVAVVSIVIAIKNRKKKAAIDKFVQAVMNNDIESMQKAYNANYIDLDANLVGVTVIEYCAKKGYSDMLAALIRLGAGLSKTKALHLAVIDYNYTCAEKLLENGMDINIENSDGQTALILIENEELLKLFISKGADFYHIDNDGRSAMDLMIDRNNQKLIALLLDAGFKIDMKINGNADTALTKAIRNNNVEIVSLLLQKGDNPDQEIIYEDKSTEGIIHFIVKNNFIELAKLLINYKVDLGTLSVIKQLPLGQAVKNKNIEMLKLLLDAKANIGYAVSWAVDMKNTEILQMLLMHGAKPDNGRDPSPLMDAALNDSPKIVGLLLQHGADIHQKNENGEGIVFAALNKGSFELFQVLVSYKADFNEKNKNGDTPLIVAIEKDDAKLVKSLLECGASVNSPNTAGKYPLGSAVEKANEAIIKIILDAKPNIDHTSLSFAVSKANTPLVLMLMNYGFEATNRDFFSALKNNHIKIFDLLAKAEKPILNGQVNPLTIETMRDQFDLKLEEVHVSTIGVDLHYSAQNLGQIPSLLREGQIIAQKLGVKLVNVYETSHGIVVKVFNSSKEAELVSKLSIRNEPVEMFDVMKKNSSTYMFFKQIRGASIKDWEREREFIENMLGQPVVIEEYDSSHELFSSNFSKENLIIIRESQLCSLPSIKELGGDFLREELIEGRKSYLFINVKNLALWEEKLSEIRQYIGKRVNIISYDESKEVLKLQDTIEEALPEILDICDDQRHYSKLVAAETENGNNFYYYSFLPGVDLKMWKDRIKKKSLRNLFNEPEKVYEVEMFDKTNPDYKPINGQDGQFFIVKELAKIPNANELMNVVPADILMEGNIFWGYGSGSLKYYSPLSNATHMMVIGGTGSGKSNFMNGIILSLIHNIDKVGKLYLIDLKSGVEFNKYIDMNSEKIEVFSRGTKPSKLLASLLEVEAEMYLRNEYMANNRLVKIESDPIFLIIDEYAQIEIMPATTMEERNAKSAILDTLLRIGSLARASNIKLFVQAQDPNKVEGELKKHMMSRILLKTGNFMDRSHALQQPDRLDELGIDHTRFGKGRLVFEDYNEGDTLISELQFPYIDPDKEYHLAYQAKSKLIDNSFEEKLRPYVDSIREEYEHLLNTKKLGGVEQVQPTDEVSDLNSSTQQEDNTDSLLGNEDEFNNILAALEAKYGDE